MRTSITAGLDRLVLMRSAGLLGARTESRAEDVSAPLFIGELSAGWAYTSGEIAFGPYREGVRAAIVDTFAWHARGSAQETLAAMADVILASYEEIASVTLSLRERPYRPADLLELSMSRDALFVVRDEPCATVEITVERK
jgi:urate oxidase